MITFCLGLPGSGSTWLYNIIRALLPPSTHAFESENLPAVRECMDRPNRDLLIKAHALEHSLLYFAQAANARAIISSRDPKDGVASMMTRFQPDPYYAIYYVVRSFAAINSAQKFLPSLALDYDDGFISSIETLHAILGFLGEGKPAPELEAIFDAYKKDNVRKLIDNIKDEAGVAFDPASGMAYDRITMFNEHHLGDGRSGKWQDIEDPNVREELVRLFGEVSGKPIRKGQALRFSESVFSETPEPHAPSKSGPGALMLSKCYLPHGRWNIRLQGTLPAPASGRAVHLCHSGAIIGSATARKGGKVDLQVLYDNAAHDNAFSLHAETSETQTIDPRRENRFILTAVFAG
jgi:hypothetical protein